MNLEPKMKLSFLHKNVQQKLVPTSQMQNLCKWVKYSLPNSQKQDGAPSLRSIHVRYPADKCLPRGHEANLSEKEASVARGQGRKNIRGNAFSIGI